MRKSKLMASGTALLMALSVIGITGVSNAAENNPNIPGSTKDNTVQTPTNPQDATMNDNAVDTTVTGTVQWVDQTDRTIRVKDTQTNTQSYTVNDNTIIRKNGVSSNLSQVRIGDSVTLDVGRDNVVKTLTINP